MQLPWKGNIRPNKQGITLGRNLGFRQESHPNHLAFKREKKKKIWKKPSGSIEGIFKASIQIYNYTNPMETSF